MLVWAIIFAAIAVRLPSLFHDGLWRDEAYVYVDVTAPAFREFLTRVVQTEWHPPLFFLLDDVWVKLAGTGEIALGLPAFAFGIATVPLVYLLGRDVRSEGTGLLAAAAYALAPIAIRYSDEYVYPMAAFSFTLLTWLVLRARRSPMTPGRFAALAGAALLCVYSHYTALLFVPMLALWALCSSGGVRRGLAIVAAMTAGSLPFALWLPAFLHQRHIGLPYAGAVSAGDAVLRGMLALVAFVPAWPEPVRQALLVALLAGVVVLTRAKRIAPDVAAMGLLFVSLLAVLQAGNLAAERYLFPAYAPFCVFLAAVALELATLLTNESAGFRRAGPVALAAIAGLIAAGDAAFALANPGVPKSGIRSFAAGGLDRNALYVIAPDYLAATFAYYARDSGAAYLAFAREERPEIFRLEGYPGIWDRPGAVNGAMGRIAAAAAGRACIVLVADAYAQDQGRMRYGRTWELLRALEARYPPAGSAAYPGRVETIAVYRFSAVPGTGAENCR